MTDVTAEPLNAHPMTREAMLGMASERAAWCITLICPLRPEHNDRSKVRLELRHLIEYVTVQLKARGVDRDMLKTHLAPLTALAEADETVPRQGQSLIAMLSPTTRRISTTTLQLDPLIQVSDRFEIGRLVAAMDAQANYYILAVADDGARLLQVAGGTSQEVMLPLDREDRSAANAERVSPVVGGSAHANRFAGSPGAGAPNAHVQGFGHERRDEIERQAWYDVIAAALGKVFGHDATAHLIVVTDVTHQAALAKNIQVPKRVTFVDHNPAGMDDAALVSRTLKTHQRTRASAQAEAASLLVEAAKADRVCTDLARARAAASDGRVELLVVKPDARTFGKRIAEGRVEPHAEPGVGDVDLVAALIGETLAKGGRLITLSEGEPLPIEPDHARFNASLRW